MRCIFEAGVNPHVPAAAGGQWNAQGIFAKEDFRYDRARDELICPAGKRLHKRTVHQRNRQTEYAASVKDCQLCPLKSQCTRTRYRVAHRHWDQDYLDRAEALRDTVGYRISQRCRKRIEHLFAEAKEQMGLRRARRRGLRNLTEQCLMTALVQNLKRIVNAIGRLPTRATGALVAVSLALIKHLAALRGLFTEVESSLASSNGSTFQIGQIEINCTE